MSVPTLMEAHAALGPITWSNGGMRATTRDGFRAEIATDPTEGAATYVVRFFPPPDNYEDLVSADYGADDLCAARVLIAQEVGAFRDAERRRRAAMAWMYEVAMRVMDNVEWQSAAKQQSPARDGRETMEDEGMTNEELVNRLQDAVLVEDEHRQKGEGRTDEEAICAVARAAAPLSMCEAKPACVEGTAGRIPLVNGWYFEQLNPPHGILYALRTPTGKGFGPGGISMSVAKPTVEAFAKAMWDAVVLGPMPVGTVRR